MKKEKGESKEQRLERWAGIIRQQAESGLTVREFCLRMGFHYGKYYDWKKKLELSGAALAEAGHGGGGDAAAPPDTALAPRGWAAVAIAEPAGSVPEPVLEPCRAPLPVEIGKCRVLASAGMDRGLFAEVCGVLVGLC